jgi:hypothetical protein
MPGRPALSKSSSRTLLHDCLRAALRAVAAGRRGPGPPCFVESVAARALPCWRSARRRRPCWRARRCARRHIGTRAVHHPRRTPCGRESPDSPAPVCCMATTRCRASGACGGPAAAGVPGCVAGRRALAVPVVRRQFGAGRGAARRRQRGGPRARESLAARQRVADRGGQPGARPPVLPQGRAPRAAAAGRRVVVLAISDVPGDDPATIGSGPWTPAPPEPLPPGLPDWLDVLLSVAPPAPSPGAAAWPTWISASSRTGRWRCAPSRRRRARDGAPCTLHAAGLGGPVATAAAGILAALRIGPPGLHAWSGETTVALPAASGPRRPEQPPGADAG